MLTEKTTASKARQQNGAQLEVQGLRRHFGGVWAVDDVSFSAERGAVTGLIGPNGAGKSTVVGLLAGALHPDAGRVIFEGRDVTSLPPHARARLGLIRTFQTSSEFRKLTVLENLLVARREQRGESFLTLLTGRHRWRAQEEGAIDKARELLEGFGMGHMEDEYAGNLSGGQKRLVEIMRALMAEPTMLLLDEPMAGVNPSLARTVEGYLQELADRGLAMVIVEHELDVVERMCAVTIVMALGRVIATGHMSDLRYQPEVLDAYLAG